MKKLFITTFLFLSLPFLLLSDVSAEGIWFPTNKPNCQVWNPNPSSEETASWSGACLSGKAHGKGSTTWRWKEDGKFVLRFIEGEMIYGRRLGQVKITYENGDLYIGKLDKNGNRVAGQGTYTSAVSEAQSIMNPIIFFTLLIITIITFYPPMLIGRFFEEKDSSGYIFTWSFVILIWFVFLRNPFIDSIKTLISNFT